MYYRKFLKAWSKLPIWGKLLLLAGLLGVITYLYLSFYYWPRQEAIEVRKRQISELEQKIAGNEQIIKNFDDYKKQERNLRKLLDQTLSLLPREREIGELLKLLGHHAEKAGIQILNFTPKGEMPKGFYSEVPLDLHLSGSYHQIAHFFDRLAAMPRLVNVSEINISAPVACKDKAVIDITCVATSFRFLGGGGEAEVKQTTTPNGKPTRKRKRR